eukprot:m.243765 g.243765  ORF g.243765 m.243765 type:complete len:460 (-) comp33819_c2_seq1:163-1542(-)
MRRSGWVVTVVLSMIIGGVILRSTSESLKRTIANLDREKSMEFEFELSDANRQILNLSRSLDRATKKTELLKAVLELNKVNKTKLDDALSLVHHHFESAQKSRLFGLDVLRGSKGIVMSCPTGAASHNPGDWKPWNLFDGITAVAGQLVHFKSSLKLVVALFDGEDGAIQACDNLQRKHAQLEIICHKMNMPIPKGYGVSKIFAMQSSPLDHAIWLDCDTFPVRDPATLFLDRGYQDTGAMFWPDIEDHFDSDLMWETDLFKINETLFPRDSWRTTQGFDSGVIVIDKSKTQSVLKRVLDMGKNYELWSNYSHGDKDLWHLAWMIAGQNFSYCQYVGAVGYFGRKHEHESVHDKWFMASQAKFDEFGATVILHQLWRSGPQYNNFFGYNWPKLSSNHARYNLPELTLRIDLQTNPNFQYGRETKEDWGKISQSLEPDQMFATTHDTRKEIDRMASLWRY